MPRYIKLDDAITTLHKYFPISFDRQDAEDDLKSIPAADVEEVKHGEWKRICVADDDPQWFCSVCGEWQNYGISKRCPECGAKMDGKMGRNEKI